MESAKNSFMDSNYQHYNNWDIFNDNDINAVLNDSETFTFFRLNNLELENLIQHKLLIEDEIFNLTTEILASGKLFENKLSVKQKLSSICKDASHWNDIKKVEDSVHSLTNELIYKLLGIPLDDKYLFLNDLHTSFIIESQEDYFKTLVEKKLFQPSNDLISSILYVENECYISHNDIINFLLLFISYGQTSISRHLTNLLRASIDNSLAISLESSRSPLTISRFSKKNINIDNVSISEGDQLTLWNGPLSQWELFRRSEEHAGIQFFFEVTLIQVLEKIFE